MPSKYVVRSYTETGVYHVFNRGVEKRNIFLDNQDYRIFLYYLTIYLVPLAKVLSRYPKLPKRLHGKNLSQDVQLISYCLMPNHFHMLLRQTSKEAVQKLLKQVTTAYTMYFNKKYTRVGSLFQGTYKSVEVPSDHAVLHLTRYIHRNPLESGIVDDLKDYRWSSHLEYKDNMGSLVNKDIVFSLFPSLPEYESFMLDEIGVRSTLPDIAHLLLEE